MPVSRAVVRRFAIFPRVSEPANNSGFNVTLPDAAGGGQGNDGNVGASLNFARPVIPTLAAGDGASMPWSSLPTEGGGAGSGSGMALARGGRTAWAGGLLEAKYDSIRFSWYAPKSGASPVDLTYNPFPVSVITMPMRATMIDVKGTKTEIDTEIETGRVRERVAESERERD